jgi:hypothetical protein
MATATEQVATNRAVVQRLYQLINRNDSDNFAEVVATDYIDRSNGSIGPEGMAAAASANLHRAYAGADDDGGLEGRGNVAYTSGRS